MEGRQRGLGGVYQRGDGRWEGRLRIRGRSAAIVLCQDPSGCDPPAYGGS
jgi:hypothetical protein